MVLGCRRAGQEVRIEVWDTGKGIPRSDTDEIFREFYQLENPERDRRKGLGLGLAIVKRLAKLLDHPRGVALDGRQGLDVLDHGAAGAREDYVPVESGPEAAGVFDLSARWCW